MRFHCLLVVRDEEDIIAQSLDHLLMWADAIYVFDTGSTDGTWEIVQETAADDSRVIPLRKDSVYYCDCLVRGWLFDQARRTMQTGDWFLRVDADEFYHVPPPEFVKTRLRTHETLVLHQYYEFVLRVSDVRAWKESLDTVADRKLPIEQRRQWYYTYPYGEPRLCRYRESMKWPASASFPHSAGFVAEARLPIRHYPHRDPTQVERRCQLRSIMQDDRVKQGGASTGQHWAQRDWSKFVFRDDDSCLKHWEPGTVLPEVRFANHLSNPSRRVIQRVTHQFLLPWIDHLRPGWRETDYPRKIPAETVEYLERMLRPEGDG